MSMALLKTSLFRSALGRPGISALAKSFGASLNISNINVSVNDGRTGDGILWWSTHAQHNPTFNRSSVCIFLIHRMGEETIAPSLRAQWYTYQRMMKGLIPPKKDSADGPYCILRITTNGMRRWRKQEWTSKPECVIWPTWWALIRTHSLKPMQMSVNSTNSPSERSKLKFLFHSFPFLQRAVEYLFPSGLFDKRARPFMLPPEKVYPARKAPQFDNTGRPTNMFFYTVSPHFYQLCHVRR